MRSRRMRLDTRAPGAFLVALGVLATAGAGRPAWAGPAGDPGPGEVCEPLGACLSPVLKPGGLAHDGTHLWVGSYNVGVSRLSRIDPMTCELAGSIPAPGRFIGGLAWDGSSLWCLPEESGVIYRIDPTDGTVLSTIPAPSFGASNPAGADLAWDGTALWHVDYATDRLYRLDPSDGAVIASFATPGALPVGLGWFGGWLVLADASLDQLLLIDPRDGSIRAACPAGDTFPWGVCIAPSGEVFVTGINSRQIRRHDMGFSAGPFTSYCDAGPSSTGAPALLSAEGSASVEADDMVLVAGGLPRGVAFFLYGSERAERPFGAGMLCVGGRLHRIGAAPARDGEARRALRLSCRRRGGAIAPGSTWNFQAIYLDQGARRGQRFNSTNGLSVDFGP